MSFCLASDEEDEDRLEESWTKAPIDWSSKDSDDGSADRQDSETFGFDSNLASPKLPSGFEFGDDDGQDSEEDGPVDWEDASDQKLPAQTSKPLQSVTIDMSAEPNPDEKKEKKKKKTRRSYQHGSLPRHTQSLLVNLHRAHWLALTSHVVFQSAQCSTELTLPVAHSLLPVRWTDPGGGCRVPTGQELKSFCTWYFDLVHHVEERRRAMVQANLAAGAPRPQGAGRNKRKRTVATAPVSSASRLLRFCSYLSSSLAEDPQLLQQHDASDDGHRWSSSDRVGLFIAMTRSMGWRARFVSSIDPIKVDLDMDHPLLMGAMKNVFRGVFSHCHDGDSKSRKRSRQWNAKTESVNITNSEAPAKEMTGQGWARQHMLTWVEVLCRVDGEGAPGKTRIKKTSNSSNTGNLKWVHVDPEKETIDKPSQVEALLLELDQGNAGQCLKGRYSRGTTRKRRAVAYVVAAEHVGASVKVTDVTSRYASSMVQSLKLRGVSSKQQAQALADIKARWWSGAVKTLNTAFNSRLQQWQRTSCGSAQGDKSQTIQTSGKSADGPPAIQTSGKSTGDATGTISDDISEQEPHEEGQDDINTKELASSFENETLPMSKENFKNHPLYAIQSVLKEVEILAPDAKKRVCGIFKGEMVYLRSDVSVALAERKWRCQGRRVKHCELGNPVKRVKARAKAAKVAGSFKALSSYGVGKQNDGGEEHQRKQLERAEAPLDDGMQKLYAIWQTELFCAPHVGPNDKIPVNEYGNVELALINPSLTHIDEPRVAHVAKQIGVPYAPCLLGFEGHGGNLAPIIRGIVVHQHNAQLLREASVEVVSKTIEEEKESRRCAIYGRWKKILVGVLTKQRLEREYGSWR